MSDFRNLEIWKRGIELTKEIYEITKGFPKSEKFGLSSQIQRAMVSVPSNIAEGASRQYKKEFIHFLYQARGSLCEVITQLEIAHLIGYINEETKSAISNRMEELLKMLNSMIKSLRTAKLSR